MNAAATARSGLGRDIRVLARARPGPGRDAGRGVELAGDFLVRRDLRPGRAGRSALVLPESADPHAGRVDMPGTMLGAGALAALIFGIINGESIEAGSVSLGHGGSTGNGPLDQIIQAGYAAFTGALHDAL